MRLYFIKYLLNKIKKVMKNNKDSTLRQIVHLDKFLKDTVKRKNLGGRSYLLGRTTANDNPLMNEDLKIP